MAHLARSCHQVALDGEAAASELAKRLDDLLRHVGR